jgi:hypothetical protein
MVMGGGDPNAQVLPKTNPANFGAKSPFFQKRVIRVLVGKPCLQHQCTKVCGFGKFTRQAQCQTEKALTTDGNGFQGANVSVHVMTAEHS